MNKSNYTQSLRPPDCHFFDEKPINNIQGFQPPSQYLIWLAEISRKNKINPSLLTGIVAQESGFNPLAVSWSKAIGLTQMTDRAEEQINIDDKKWPRSREISSLNYMELKNKVTQGEINEDNEWRLHPQKSLQGGAEYILYLHNYWNLEENKRLLTELKGDPHVLLSKILLASYNSGPARVKLAIQNYKNDWLKKSDLKEAQKYVSKVMSYCFHFSERSVADDG